MTEIHELYDLIAKDYDRDRNRNRGRRMPEAGYLGRVASGLKPGAEVLDLGCGSGEPIARFFIEQGFGLTGVDAAPAMLALCRERFPEADFAVHWVEQDMRGLDLCRRFDAIIAWDSFFHLDADDQRRMFAIFERHTAPDGYLLFTSGPRAGIAMGDMYGHPLFHASLDPEEYTELLDQWGFEVILHRSEDPDCGRHTVWLAQRVRRAC